jgi:hypothetical protein
MDYQEAFEFALQVSKEAGDFIKQAFYQEKAIHFKDTVDLVTDTVRVDFDSMSVVVLFVVGCRLLVVGC